MMKRLMRDAWNRLATPSCKDTSHARLDRILATLASIALMQNCTTSSIHNGARRAMRPSHVYGVNCLGFMQGLPESTKRDFCCVIPFGLETATLLLF